MICLQTHNLIIHFSSTREPCSDSVELRTCRGKTWWLTEILSWEFTARGALLVMLLCATHLAAAHPQTAALHAKATVIQGRGKKSRAIATAAAAAAYEEELQQPATLPFFSCFSWQAVNLALRPLPKVKGQQHLQHRLRHQGCSTHMWSRRAPASSGAQQQVWPSIFPITARWTSFNPRTKPLGKRQHSLPWYYNGLPDAEKPTTTLIHINWYVRDTLGRTSNLLLKLKLGYFFEELATCNGDSNATLCRACCMSYVRWRWSRFLVPWLFSALVNVTGVAPSVMKYWTLLQPFSIAPPAWLKVEATSN